MVLGGSGSGKSTLARLLVGLEALTTGHIYVDGQDLTRMSERELDGSAAFAMVFQKYALLDSLTVYDNVAFPLARAGPPPREARDPRARDAPARRPGIADAAHKLPGSFRAEWRSASGSRGRW